MDDSVLHSIVDKYFDYFQQKDVEGLQSIIEPNFSLRDWETNLVGLDNFLAKIQVIFESFDEIIIKRITTDLTGTKAFCVIEIALDRAEPITVMDIITNNNQRKIVSVNAFRQF